MTWARIAEKTTRAEFARMLQTMTIDEVATALECLPSAVEDWAQQWHLPIPRRRQAPTTNFIAGLGDPDIDEETWRRTGPNSWDWAHGIPVIVRPREEEPEMPIGIRIEETLPRDELVKRLAWGRTYTEIAEEFGLHEQAVGRYVRRIGARDEAERLRAEIESQTTLSTEDFSDPDLPEGFHIEEPAEPVDDELQLDLQRERERESAEEDTDDDAASIWEYFRAVLEPVREQAGRMDLPKPSEEPPLLQLSITTCGERASDLLATLGMLVGVLGDEQLTLEVTARRAE